MSGGGGIRRFLRTADSVLRAASYDTAGIAPKSPLMVYVELTRRCNMKCRHCDIWMTASKHKDLKRTEVSGERLLEVLTGQVERGLLAVDLFGGEPLMRTDLEEIIRGLKTVGVHVTVTTNGTLVDENRAAGMVEAGLDQLLVSIDGPEASVHDGIRGREGTFDKAVAGLEAFLAAGGRKAGVNTLVCRENIDHLPAMVDLTSRIGARQLRLLPYHQCYPFNQYGQDDELLPRQEDLSRLDGALDGVIRKSSAQHITTNGLSYLEGIIRWYAGEPVEVRCMAGLAVCDINAFGDVYPCYTLGRPVGSIREAAFDSLWSGEAMEAHRKSTGNCRECWQSCYIEPGLRLSLRALLQDRKAVLHDIMEYFVER